MSRHSDGLGRGSSGASTGLGYPPRAVSTFGLRPLQGNMYSDDEMGEEEYAIMRERMRLVALCDPPEAHISKYLHTL